VRFGVRFGLTPEAGTLQAMKKLAPTMEKLAKERVFEELCKLLPLVNADDLCTYQDILAQVVPALSDCVGFQQHNPHHRYDVYTHTAQVVENVPADLALRWAALLHDCGKPDTFFLDETGRGHFHGHAKVSAEKADALLANLKAPNALRERVVFLIDHHMTEFTPDKKLLRKRLGKYGVEATLQLLLLQEADFGGKGTKEETTMFSEIRRLLDEVLAEDACLRVQDLKVDGRDLMAIGFPPGKMLGNCLACLLEQVQDEQIPNEKDALTLAATAFLQKNTEK
jgi:tRNA nucleotidyltransferase (CCA-adding enzyme)